MQAVSTPFVLALVLLGAVGPLDQEYSFSVAIGPMGKPAITSTLMVMTIKRKVFIFVPPFRVSISSALRRRAASQAR